VIRRILPVCAWLAAACCSVLLISVVVPINDESASDSARWLRATPAAAVTQANDWLWNLPEGVPLPKVPAENVMSRAKVELGRHLFYDTRLSANETQSCASCHIQLLAFTDGLGQARGSTGEIHPRSSMSLANIAYASTLTWANPNLRLLEQQALVPIFGEEPVEMGMAGKEAEMNARLKASQVYPELFEQAFPDESDPVTLDGVTRALAAFQRSLISVNSPYDRYLRGDDDAISPEALVGESLFFSEQLECFHCHGGPFFTSSMDYEGKGFAEIEFFNTGLYNLDGAGSYPEPNTGVHTFTGDPRDMGRFRAPTLRNIAVTAPYMHDGSILTLEEVVEHYAAGGRTVHEGPTAGVGSRSPLRSEFMVGFELSVEEKAALVEYLRTLTDDSFLSDPRHSDPWAATTRR